MSTLMKSLLLPSSRLLLSQFNGLSNQTRLMIHTSAAVMGSGHDIKKNQLIAVDKTKYSMKRFKLPRTGGRGLDGRIETRRIGGGSQRNYRMIDIKRGVDPDLGQFTERVLDIQKDPNRTARIAVVAGNDKKRYLLATENMKVGDIITSSMEIPLLPVQAHEGNAHPLGALSIGTLVHNVEKFPNEGGYIARAAGTSATVLRKIGDMVVVRMPSLREICLHQTCMATVGRVSNVDHNKEIIGSPNRSRWLGIRPRSGLKHKKTGYNGRKIRPIKPMVTVDVSARQKPEIYKLEA